MFQADPVAGFGLVTVALCWSLAVVLFRADSRNVARLLSLLLVVEGVTLASSGVLDFFLSPELRTGPAYGRWTQISLIVHLVGDGGRLALYPLFRAAALDPPLVRPIARPAARAAILAGAAALVVLALAAPMRVGLVTH